MYKALDLSNYDIDASLRLKGAELVAAGFPAFIMGAQRTEPAIAIATSMLAAGCKLLGVYAYLYFGFDVAVEVNKAIDVANRFGSKVIFLDVESTPAQENGLQTPSSRIAHLKFAINIAEAAGFRVVIYTYGPYWISSMGNTSEFKEYPLWYANYGRNDGTLAPIERVSFGGWDKVAIHQYCSGVSIAGRNRDQNYVLDTELFPLEEEEDMTALEELNQAVVKRMAIINLASGEYTKMLRAYENLKLLGLVE